MADALEEQQFQADLFIDNDIILIHCCDLENAFRSTVESLPFLQIKVCFGHFSFQEFPSKRRACILPLSEDLLQRLHNVHSPAVVRVKSSFLYKVCYYVLYAVSNQYCLFEVYTILNSKLLDRF